MRSSANEQLSAAFRDAVEGAAAGERQVQGTLAYASPMIWSASVPEDVRDGPEGAGRGDRRGRVREPRASSASGWPARRVLPWHEPQAAARAELLALIDAQRARFDGIANDASDIDLVLADGPLPVGAVTEALSSAGAD